jgi:hypothetical protein
MEVGMKGKIETAANIIVILFAVIVGSVFLKDRLSTVPPESNVVKAGDKLANLDGWDWSAHDQTPVLVLRKGCHFCEDSAPLYQRLNTQKQQGGSNSSIVAVFPDTNDAAKEVVQSEGLGVQALPAPLVVDTSEACGAWKSMGDDSNQFAVTFNRFLFAGARTSTELYGSFFPGQYVGKTTVQAVGTPDGDSISGSFTNQFVNLGGQTVFAGSGTFTARA